jgi:hypothetical protein
LGVGAPLYFLRLKVTVEGADAQLTGDFGEYAIARVA